MTKLTFPGSGKTAAYLIPIISKFTGKVPQKCKPLPAADEQSTYVAEPNVLIVVPTRELAGQIFDEVRRLSYRSLLRPCVAYGGAPFGAQKAELQKGCDILIAVPGRLLDFVGKGVIDLSRVR